MSEKKLYLHFINMAPSTQGALVDLTVELEPDRKIVIGLYTANKTLAIATGPQPEGIVNPPDPPNKKPEVKKIGLDIRSVSRNHGTFSRAGEEVYYQDHSTYGTGYQNSRSQGSGEAITRLSNETITIVPGDVLYFGQHTDQIPFKYCIALTRRARYRKK
ncbi:MAG: FHA domain-containing protein [Acidobacteriota bacterium]|nr:FHA domain-containing protein [Acidobacteriota bacterium]